MAKWRGGVVTPRSVAPIHEIKSLLSTEQLSVLISAVSGGPRGGGCDSAADQGKLVRSVSILWDVFLLSVPRDWVIYCSVERR